MNIFRIVLFSLLTALAYFQVSGQVAAAFSQENTIEVDGVLNMWASFSGLLIGIYAAVYSFKLQFRLNIPMGDASKIIVLVAISGMAYVPSLRTAIDNNLSNNHYVECKNERKVSSRYSSRTYAISNDACKQLEHN